MVSCQWSPVADGCLILTNCLYDNLVPRFYSVDTTQSKQIAHVKCNTSDIEFSVDCLPFFDKQNSFDLTMGNAFLIFARGASVECSWRDPLGLSR